MGKFLAIIMISTFLGAGGRLSCYVLCFFEKIDKPKYDKKTLKFISWILYPVLSLIYVLSLYAIDKWIKENYFLISGMVLYPFVLALIFKLKGYFDEFYLKKERRPIFAYMVSILVFLIYIVISVFIIFSPLYFWSDESDDTFLKFFFGWFLASWAFVAFLFLQKKKGIK